MDLVIAVVIFGFIAVIFYSLLLIQQKPSVEELQARAQDLNVLLEAGVGPCGSIIDGQSVTPDKLQCLFSLDYASTKTQLRVQGDFCIYLEDDNGKIYIVGNNTIGNKTGFGSDTLIVGGTPCGQNAT